MIGQTDIGPTGESVEILVDQSTEFKSTGVSIDWDTCPSSNADVEIDGRTIPAGTRYLPKGTVMAEITASGKYAPAHTGAGDGRETLTNGKCGLLKGTIVQGDTQDELVGLVIGGNVYQARCQFGATLGTTNAATQPALAAVLAAMPRLTMV